MGEPTREQIEAYAQSPYPALAVGDQEALCALAIEALDTRAELATLRKDAALGAKVRAAFGGMKVTKMLRIATKTASECEDGTFAELVFPAIADAIREDGR